MTLAIVFAVFGAIALFLVIFLVTGQLARGRDLDQLASQLRPLDVAAFCNLMSPDEEQYLRDHLPARDFRAVHRKRMLAAAEYVRCAARNAAILSRLGEAARLSPDPSVVTAAEKLLESAVRLRLFALKTIPQLYIAILFPALGRNSLQVADSYDSVRSQAVMLGCLRFPTRGMPSAL
jgi:hypothetical protein